VNNLRAFYNYLKAIPGCPVEINPFSKVFVKAPTKVSSDKQPTEALSPREVKVLFATCNLGESMGKRNSCILAALFYCGLRVHEVAGLNVGGVVMNTSHPYLILPKSKGRDDIVRQPLPAGAIPHFKRWLRVREWHKAHDYEPLFIPRQGQGEFLAKRMSSETIRALVVRLGKKSGVERHISSHTGRATAITQLLRRKDEGGCGMSPQDVLKFSRHADIRMVMRYYKELYGLESNVGYELKY
jgi:integrase/recombinase XerC